MITLDRKNLHELSASPGQAGFTRKQIELLGFDWPAKKGWLSSLIGTQITEEKYAAVKAACRIKWQNGGFTKPTTQPIVKLEPNLSQDELRRVRFWLDQLEHRQSANYSERCP